MKPDPVLQMPTNGLGCAPATSGKMMRAWTNPLQGGVHVVSCQSQWLVSDDWRRAIANTSWEAFPPIRQPQELPGALNGSCIQRVARQKSDSP